jgi:hypothetical protein
LQWKKRALMFSTRSESLKAEHVDDEPLGALDVRHHQHNVAETRLRR